MLSRAFLFAVALASCQPDPLQERVADGAPEPEAVRTASLPSTLLPEGCSGALTVVEVLAHDPGAGQFDVCGYVIATHECGACPAGADCAPCAPSQKRVTLGGTPGILLRGQLWAPDHIDIQTGQPGEFEVGGVYRVAAEPLPFAAADSTRPAHLVLTLRMTGARRL